MAGSAFGGRGWLVSAEAAATEEPGAHEAEEQELERLPGAG